MTSIFYYTLWRISIQRKTFFCFIHLKSGRRGGISLQFFLLSRAYQQYTLQIETHTHTHRHTKISALSVIWATWHSPPVLRTHVSASPRFQTQGDWCRHTEGAKLPKTNLCLDESVFEKKRKRERSKVFRPKKKKKPQCRWMSQHYNKGETDRMTSCLHSDTDAFFSLDIKIVTVPPSFAQKVSLFFCLTHVTLGVAAIYLDLNCRYIRHWPSIKKHLWLLGGLFVWIMEECSFRGRLIQQLVREELLWSLWHWKSECDCGCFM